MIFQLFFSSESPFTPASSASLGKDTTLYIILGTVLGLCVIVAVIVVIVVCRKHRKVCQLMYLLTPAASSCLCRNLDPDTLCWHGTLFHPDLHEDCDHDSTSERPSLEITLQPCTDDGLCGNLGTVCWHGIIFHPDLHDGCEHVSPSKRSSLEITSQPCTDDPVALGTPSQHLHGHARFVHFNDHVTIYNFDPHVSLEEEGNLERRLADDKVLFSALK